LVVRAPLVLLALLLLSGCDPDCRQSCRHLLNECGVDRASYGVEDCTAQCQAFLTHYEDDWQRPNSRQAVRCVNDASCEELRTGTPCYDEAVYVW
jgi:hypothetical protein